MSNVILILQSNNVNIRYIVTRGEKSMKKSKICDGNRGFTLVELIVVLVILAILAAILVPALLGYIDRARSRQDILNAKNCMTATQAELTYMYANRKDSFTDATGTNTATSGDYGDLFLKNSDFAQKIFKTADVEPYMFIVGIGKYDVYKDTDIHKAYTCYFAAYWGKKDSDPIFFNGSTWVKDSPWVAVGANTFDVNGEPISLQMYVLASPNNSNAETWSTLKNKVINNQ